MSELHSWLSTQHHGLRTYKSLKQKLIARASADPEHAALYRLLASMIDPYIDSFHPIACHTTVRDYPSVPGGII
jgi:hypothetical protein